VLANRGPGPVHVEVRALTKPFRVVAALTRDNDFLLTGPGDFTLNAGESCRILVEFRPEAAGVFRDQLLVVSHYPYAPMPNQSTPEPVSFALELIGWGARDR
jgi:hypothetical protein